MFLKSRSAISNNRFNTKNTTENNITSSSNEIMQTTNSSKTEILADTVIETSSYQLERDKAYSKLKAHGDEWPEEEDLPYNTTMSSTNTVKNNDSNDSLSKTIIKEKNIALQRNQKLKVAERNSKY